VSNDIHWGPGCEADPCANTGACDGSVMVWSEWRSQDVRWACDCACHNANVHDEQDAFARRLEQVILTEAAVWETNFPAGPGMVVSVSDAARVIGKALNASPQPFAVGGAVTAESFEEAHRSLHNSPCPAETLSTPRPPKSDPVRAAGARARVAADRKRGAVTPEWIVKLAEG
jgi:hypothetical protein